MRTPSVFTKLILMSLPMPRKVTAPLFPRLSNGTDDMDKAILFVDDVSVGMGLEGRKTVSSFGHRYFTRWV
jgi:hypothetical protein